MIPYNKKLVSNARTLRKNMTPEEIHLWLGFLKKLPITVKRQHNIDNYIVDFYIPQRKIVIEVDGRQHEMAENKQADAERDAVLASWGITVLRYPNDRIRKHFQATTTDILRHLDIDLSSEEPSSPSPVGEGGPLAVDEES